MNKTHLLHCSLGRHSIATPSVMVIIGGTVACWIGWARQYVTALFVCRVRCFQKDILVVINFMLTMQNSLDRM
jgi:hypothetical protein